MPGTDDRAPPALVAFRRPIITKGSSMRPTTPLAIAAAIVGVLTPAGTAAAAAAPASHTESFVMTFQTFNGVDLPARVSATGPVQGAGVETQTDVDTPTGETVTFTWHLRDGDVYLQAIEDYAMSVDLQACTAKATGTGTWVITGGTGRYTNATGTGTFTDHGSFTGARDHGVCDSNTTPKTSVFTLQGTGTAALGS
jgi:hypothetical protein